MKYKFCTDDFCSDRCHGSSTGRTVLFFLRKCIKKFLTLWETVKHFLIGCFIFPFPFVGGNFYDFGLYDLRDPVILHTLFKKAQLSRKRHFSLLAGGSKQLRFQVVDLSLLIV